MIGKNSSVIEWTWKVDFIDPLALEIHIQGHGSFYLFGYEYFRNQCIHIVPDNSDGEKNTIPYYLYW